MEDTADADQVESTPARTTTRRHDKRLASIGYLADYTTGEEWKRLKDITSRSGENHLFKNNHKTPGQEIGQHWLLG